MDGGTPSTRPLKIVGGVMLAGLVGAVAFQLAGIRPGSVGVKPVTPAPAVAPWYPSGYSLTMDSTVAYRWEPHAACEIMDSCWGMVLIPRDGCPSGLYVELSIVDNAGAAVGYANDTVGAVRAGQQAKMLFENTEEPATKATLADVSCR